MSKVTGIHLNNASKIITPQTNISSYTLEELHQAVLLNAEGKPLDYSDTVQPDGTHWEVSQQYSGLKRFYKANESIVSLLDTEETPDSAIVPSIITKRPIYHLYARYWDRNIQNIHNSGSPTGVTETLTTDYNTRNNFSIYLYTENVPDNTVVPYTITGAGITSADIFGAPLTGIFTVSGGYGYVVFQVSEDFTTEGDETLTLALNTGESIQIKIQDTSLNPYSILAVDWVPQDVTSVDEGSWFKFVIVSNRTIVDGTPINFTISGDGVDRSNLGFVGASSPTSMTGTIYYYDNGVSYSILGHRKYAYTTISIPTNYITEVSARNITITLEDGTTKTVGINDIAPVGAVGAVYKVEIINRSTGLRENIPSDSLIGLAVGATANFDMTTMWVRTPSNATPTNSFNALRNIDYNYGFNINFEGRVDPVDLTKWQLIPSNDPTFDGYLIAPKFLVSPSVVGLGSDALVKVTLVSEAVLFNSTPLPYSQTINLKPAITQYCTGVLPQIVTFSIGSDPFLFAIGQAITLVLNGVPYSYVSTTESKLDAVNGLCDIINSSDLYTAEPSGQEEYTHEGTTYVAEKISITGLDVTEPFTFSANTNRSSQIINPSYPVVTGDVREESDWRFTGDFALVVNDTLVDFVPVGDFKLILPFEANYNTPFKNSDGGIAWNPINNTVGTIKAYFDPNNLGYEGKSSSLIPSTSLGPTNYIYPEQYSIIRSRLLSINLSVNNPGLHTYYISRCPDILPYDVKPPSEDSNYFIKVVFQAIENIPSSATPLVTISPRSTINNPFNDYLRYIDPLKNSVRVYYYFREDEVSKFRNSIRDPVDQPNESDTDRDNILFALDFDSSVNLVSRNIGATETNYVLSLGESSPSYVVFRNHYSRFYQNLYMWADEPFRTIPVYTEKYTERHPLITSDSFCIEGFFYPTSADSKQFLFGTSTGDWSFTDKVAIPALPGDIPNPAAPPQYGDSPVTNLNGYPVYCELHTGGVVALYTTTKKTYITSTGATYYWNEINASSFSVPGVMLQNSWSHIALVVDTIQVKVYVNGTCECSLALGDCEPLQYTKYDYVDWKNGLVAAQSILTGDTFYPRVTVGSRDKKTFINQTSGLQDAFKGYVKEFRVTDSARYTNNFSKFSPIGDDAISTSVTGVVGYLIPTVEFSSYNIDYTASVDVTFNSYASDTWVSSTAGDWDLDVSGTTIIPTTDFSATSGNYTKVFTFYPSMLEVTVIYSVKAEVVPIWTIVPETTSITQGENLVVRMTTSEPDGGGARSLTVQIHSVPTNGADSYLMQNSITLPELNGIPGAVSDNPTGMNSNINTWCDGGVGSFYIPVYNDNSTGEPSKGYYLELYKQVYTLNGGSVTITNQLLATSAIITVKDIVPTVEFSSYSTVTNASIDVTFKHYSTDTTVSSTAGTWNLDGSGITVKPTTDFSATNGSHTTVFTFHPSETEVSVNSTVTIHENPTVEFSSYNIANGTVADITLTHYNYDTTVSSSLGTWNLNGSGITVKPYITFNPGAGNHTTVFTFHPSMDQVSVDYTVYTPVIPTVEFSSYNITQNESVDITFNNYSEDTTVDGSAGTYNLDVSGTTIKPTTTLSSVTGTYQALFLFHPSRQEVRVDYTIIAPVVPDVPTVDLSAYSMDVNASLGIGFNHYGSDTSVSSTAGTWPLEVSMPTIKYTNLFTATSGTFTTVFTFHPSEIQVPVTYTVNGATGGGTGDHSVVFSSYSYAADKSIDITFNHYAADTTVSSNFGTWNLSGSGITIVPNKHLLTSVGSHTEVFTYHPSGIEVPVTYTITPAAPLAWTIIPDTNSINQGENLVVRMTTPEQDGGGARSLLVHIIHSPTNSPGSYLYKNTYLLPYVNGIPGARADNDIGMNGRINTSCQNGVGAFYIPVFDSSVTGDRGYYFELYRPIMTLNGGTPFTTYELLATSFVVTVHPN